MDILQEIKIRSTLKEELLAHSLKRGGWIAALGALGMVAGGTFLTLAQLKIGGIPLFLGGLSLIGFGMGPYKKLAYWQLKPHEIRFDGEAYYFIYEGKALFRVPLASVKKMEYREEGPLKYGICVFLQPSASCKVGILQKGKRWKQFWKGDHLFLPYFTRPSLDLLLQEDDS